MFGSISRLFKSGASKKKKKDEQSPFAAPADPPGKTAATVVPDQAPAETSFTSFLENDRENLAASELISVPLSAILKRVPKELLGIDASSGASKCKFTLSKQRAIEQLSNGAVKVKFGTIRKSVPSGVFINTGSNDNEEISLPLEWVLKQLEPDSFKRNEAQKITVVPEAIHDLFGPKGEGLTEVRILKKEDLKSPAKSSESAGPSPESRQAPTVPGPAVPAAPKAAPTSSIPAPQLPIPPSTPSNQAKGAPVISGSSLLQSLGESGAATPVQKKSSPLAPKPAAGAASRQSGSTIPFSPPTPSSPAESSSHLTVTLSQIQRDWPEAVVAEINQANWSDLPCALPIEMVRQGLQQGKVNFTWGQIRSWIDPSPESSGASPHAEASLAIPLDVVTPLFLRAAVLPAKQNPSSLAGVPDVFGNQMGKQPMIKPEGLPASSAQTTASPTAPAAQPKRKTTKPASQTIPTPTLARAQSAPPQAASGQLTLKIALASVSATWPPEIQQEIQSFKISGSHLSIPAVSLEAGLKSGRIETPWQQVLAWIVDAPGGGNPESAMGDKVLNLPLDIIAPMYFQLRQVSAAKKAAVPEEIPDVFSAKGEKLTPPASQTPVQRAAPVPAPQAPVAPVAAPAAAPTTATPQPPEEKKTPKNIAELFGEPNKKSWTPKEIVQRTAQIHGISGALIALQDGLLVASCLPPGSKSETLAAFIPQMFGRMNQYTKELSMGDLQALTIHVDQGPLRVFSAGLIYFAVLGKNELNLPVEELSIITNELSRHTK